MLATANTPFKPVIQKPQYRSGAHLFFSFFGKNPFVVTGAMVLSLISVFLRLLPAIFIGRSIDILVSEGYGGGFLLMASLIPISALINFFFSFAANYTFAIVSIDWERDIRQEYFDVVQSHSLTFHDENNSSKLLSLGMNEIQFARHGIMPAFNIIIGTIFSVSLVLFFMSQLIRPELVIFTAVGFILYFILAFMYAKKVGPVRKQLSESVGEVTERSQEIFRGIEVVRGLGGQEREISKFRTKSKEYASLGKKEARMSAFFVPGLILLLITAIIFAVSIFDIPDRMTVGELITVLGLLLTLQFTNFMMPFMLINLRAAIVNSGRLSEKMNYIDPFENKTTETIADVDWKGDIEFENVIFSYGPEFRNSIEDISFTIPANSKVALIGGPGSGKTTLMKLLLQLYFPQKGSIRVGGVDYAEIAPSDVRRHVSMVEQEVFLFSGNIRDNISFTNPNATEDEIIDAAKAAQAWEFIEKMPDGLDTIIGERGITLSGGQRQRIAISRSILADPEILLLDDSSSALDSKTELLIRKALDNLSQNRLTITVTQRLNTLVTADIVILLDKGKIFGMGTHNELYKSNDKYKMIFELLPESERIFAEQEHDQPFGGAD